MLPLLVAAAVLQVGEPAPPLKIERLLRAPQGSVANWQALKGKAVVLEFWDTRNTVCIEQIPHWNALVERFRGRPIQFIAVTYEDPDLLATFFKQRPMAGWIALDPARATFKAYGVDEAPQTVLVDAKGLIHGITPLAKLTESDLDGLLRGRNLRLAAPAAPDGKPALRPDRAPRLLSPLPNARVPYAVTFRWSGVPGAAAYAIQVSDKESFPAPLLVDETATELSYRADLRVAGPLWWRVRALDSRGTPGPWSPARKLEILPPPLAAKVLGITLTPSSVVGGEHSQGLVALDQAAPPGGATVPLSASDSAKVAIPPRVLFAEGKSEAPFSIDTLPVSGDTPVRITATARSGTQVTVLTILPPRARAVLSAVAVNPAILTAGTRAQGTVTLAGLATSATTVRLLSSDPSRVTLPASVRIPAGAGAASFPVETAHVTTSGKVTITAALEDAVRTATVDLNPAADSVFLPAPAPKLPSEGASVVHDSPIEFEWSEVMGAASYTIEVGGDGDFSGPLDASRTVPASRLTITPLPPGGLWWRVCANDSSGAPGRWSAPRLLRVR
jgi:peroxiredoxin